MVIDWDTFIRIASAGASFLLLMVMLAGRIRPPLKVALAGLLIGSAAYVINSSTTILLPRWIDPWIDFVSLLTPFWAWLFARRLFERDAPPLAVWGFMAVFFTFWFMGHFMQSTRPVGFYGIHAASLVLLADLIRVAWLGRGDDLIEKRRVIRMWLPILVALQAAGILVFEVIVGANIPYPEVQLVNGLLILTLTVFAAVILLETDAELLVDTAESEPVPPAEPTLSPAEHVLREKLDAAMAEGYYRTPGLTITTLAAHLETPEHRLRALINQRLGERNFSGFLNRHRIAEAKEKLADKAHVDLPVLTIAMDLGYNSLPTFNRAFRSETGSTPTDFRRLAIGESPKT